MKTAAWQLFTLAPIEVTAEAVSMASGKTPPFEGMTPGKPVQIFPKGEARTVDGRKVRCEAEDFQLLLGDLATRKNPVTITVEHEMDPLWGSRAAGECSEFEVRTDGFWGLNPHWTKPALEEIKTGTRRWISPTFFGTFVEDDETVRPRVLRDFTLCSVPNLDGMQPVTASASRGEPGSGRLHTPAPVGSTPTPGTTPSPTTQTHSPAEARNGKEQETMKLSAESLKLLGLADGASPEDIDKAVVQLAASRPDVKALVREEMAAEREAIRTEVKAELERESAKKARETRATALLQRAEREGKLVADNRERLTKLCAADPDAFEATLPDLKVLAPVAPALSGNAAEPAESDSAALDAAARELQKASLAAGKPMTYSQAVVAASAKKVA